MTTANHIKTATGQSCLSRYATAGEAKAARALVRAILAKGHLVTVNDGCENTVIRSSSFNKITAALCTTGEDVLTARDADGVKLGRFWLIYGNDADGSELVADHTDNAYCAGILA